MLVDVVVRAAVCVRAPPRRSTAERCVLPPRERDKSPRLRVVSGLVYTHSSLWSLYT